MNIPIFNSYYYTHYNSLIRRYYEIRRRMGLPTLRSIHWVTTLRCNFTCKGCEAGRGAVDTDELTTSEMRSLVREMCGMGVRTLEVGGGEPLLREDVFEIIDQANELGLNVGMGTNSYLVKHFDKELRKSKLAWMFTSIDGLEQTSDSYRGMPGAFNRATEALDYFRKIGVPTRIVVTVVHPGNLHELQELGKSIGDSGATLWRIAPCLPVGRAEDDENLMLNDEQLKQIMAFVVQSRRCMKVELTDSTGYLGCWDTSLRYNPFLCKAGIKFCAILPDGNVLGCQLPYDSRFSQGNIREKPLKEIWRDGFQEFREPVLSDECKRCDSLKSCSGGCWLLRQSGKQCFKSVLENWDGGGTQRQCLR